VIVEETDELGATMVRSMTMTGGLLDLDAMVAHAESDARLEGKDWLRLSKSQQEAYLNRVEAGYKAAAFSVLRRQIEQRVHN
jgi:hypothetical protein